jgi:hypothetical protein
MIKLDVEGYCQNCLDFNPVVVRPTRIIHHDGETEFGDALVQCENRKRCAGIKRYLDQQKAKEES